MKIKNRDFVMRMLVENARRVQLGVVWHRRKAMEKMTHCPVKHNRLTHL